MLAGPEHRRAIAELVEVYREQLAGQWPTMLALLIGTVIVGLAWNRWIVPRSAEQPRALEWWIRPALLLGFIGVGLWMVLDRAACYDDAYISLRYVDNLLAGEGLVFNPGERVEGYTNFLWTILIAALRFVLPFETPLIAVVLCMIAWVANLVVIERIARTIAPAWHPKAASVPIAVALLAIQQTFVDYGTSGLETGFASLLVDLGLLALLREPSARNGFLAGLCWILATLTRPDHAIFYAVGSAVVFGIWVRPTWQALRRERKFVAVWRAGLEPMFAYAAPFLLWLAHLAWRVHYYGELLPNTYWAKSADVTYYAQGFVYATEFHLGSHLWLVIAALAILVPMAWPKEAGPARRFAAFAIPAIVLYEWYVVRVGGDFMVGRFYVSVLPLLLLLGELTVRRLRLGPAALLLAGVLASTAVGVRLLEPNKIQWHLADENSYYRIVEWSPIVIDHDNYWIGRTLGELEAQGIEPVLSTGAIGLVGYYSRLETIDRLGLTDAKVARQKLPDRRSRPGHEKYASVAYLRQRGVHFVRGIGSPKWLGAHGKVRFGGITRDWTILHWDPELMAAIRESGVDVAFEDLEDYLDDHIARLPRFDEDRVREEHAYLKRIYFDHHDDPDRLRAYETYLEWVDAGHEPKQLLERGRWKAWQRR